MRILVVDDDPLILDALSVGFQLQWKDAEVISATDGETGLNLFYEHVPDIAILDVGLPLKNGFEVLQAIRKVSDVPVIILTARGQESDQVRGLELGADDYMVKPFAHMVLIARIKAVLRRAESVLPHGANPDFVSGDLAVNLEDGTVTVRGDSVRLTPMEYKLLCLLVRNQGRLITHEALINRMWSEDYGATSDHLKVFISRLRAKLDSADLPLIETHRGIGYRFVGQPDKPKDRA